MRTFPKIRLRISNHSTPQAVQAVRNGEVDFAVVSTPAEAEAPLNIVELESFREILVGGRHLHRAGKPDPELEGN